MPLPSSRLLFSRAIVFVILSGWLSLAQAQVIAVNDVFCFTPGQTFGPADNVLNNDQHNPVLHMVMPMGELPCLQLLPSGSFVWTTSDFEGCCGTFTLNYAIVMLGGGNPLSIAQVEVTIKCPKPDCTIFDLSYLMDPSQPSNPSAECISVCENSQTTFFVPHDNTSTYTWTVISGGIGIIVSNPAEYIVNWGPQGSGILSLTITDANNVSTTYTTCIDILQGPTAGFTGPAYACLNTQVCFNNTSVNAVSYLWDFGDGNFSSMPDPCYTYTTPGFYTVTLTATNQNYDRNGNPLCCCTDVYTMEIEIDELPGPSIYWVSTLCEGDSACYWTDATNCSSYTWTVLDALGNDITSSISGQGTDTICVTWSIGPIGTIVLDVSGCDSSYCNNPTTVNVPIIPSVSTISGPILVCAFSTEVYSLPKWLSTSYDWSVSGGTLLPGDTTHVEPISWGPPGTGFITVNYTSTFLSGLPGKEEGACSGMATLPVQIRPSYGIVNNGPSTVCVGDLTTVSATPFPSSNYVWSISPSVPFSGNGTANLSVVWPTAGTYVITATPATTGIYCNGPLSIVVSVLDVPIPLAITAITPVCPGETVYYTATPAAPGFGFAWSAVGGSVAPTTGATVAVTWGSSGPYSISVSHTLTSQPFCQSAPLTVAVPQKGPHGPYTITGGPSCTNSLATYTLAPAPHPDATITWQLSDPSKGSIVSGQGSTSIQVQYGNVSAPSFQVLADVNLCGASQLPALSVNLIPAQVPVITQAGNLCPGGTVTLNATPGFSSYNWSTGSMTSSTVASGPVTLNTIDANNCPATALFNPVPLPAPVAQITSPDLATICIPTPHTVTLLALTNPNYEFTWFCNSTLVQGPSGVPTFVHPFVGAGAATFVYYVVVKDLSTGCISQSDNFVVFESPCPGGGGGGGCVPEAFSLSGAASALLPNCNQFGFSFTSSNFTFDKWHFGNGATSTSPNPTYTYPSVGCFNAKVCGFVPDAMNPGEECYVCSIVDLCVPVVADFQFNRVSCFGVDFTDFSVSLPGAPNVITSWQWNFGFSSFSGQFPPTVTFPTGGSFPVTLTVTTQSGCQATITKIVNITTPPPPTITAVPNPVCEGVPIAFSASAPGATSFLWNFSDGGTFSGPSLSYSFAVSGPQFASVTATDALGCSSSNGIPVIVFPAVPPGVITSPDFVICQGQTTTLSAPIGYSYSWQPGSLPGNPITVGAGSYTVTISDANNCSRVLGPVEVVELPLPVANIAGNLVICDAGCTTLSVPLETGHSYQWLDDNLLPIGGQTAHTMQVCDFSLLPAFYVEITDANGCQYTAGPVVVSLAISPVFSVSVAPLPACAGQPTLLNVIPFDPTLNYIWSNNATGPTTTVYAAGVHTVIGIDPATGCAGTASATVNPLPDLCLVPEGCYDICNPDTICAPPGYVYQWNLNGIPILGETNQCIIITASGNYSLTATNTFGCTATTGPLILNVIDCDETLCDELVLDYEYLVNFDTGQVDSCCVKLSYTNPGGIEGMVITSYNASLSFIPGSIHPSLGLQSVSANSISLGSNPAGNDLPIGSIADFITLCIANATASPQYIVIDWLGEEYEVLCSDTLWFDCPVEPDCIYTLEDEIYCEDGKTFYSFVVCNPVGSSYNIGYIDVLPLGPTGIIVTPLFFDITSTPLTPGSCQSFTVELSGSGIEGGIYCYKLTGHEFNPAIEPGTLCCTSDTICVPIPICDPCQYVGVEGFFPSASPDCCYDLILYNLAGPGWFDAIQICTITPGTSISSINNPFGSGWLTQSATSTSVTFVSGPPIGFIPTGFFTMPNLCFETNSAPPQLIEVKWLNGENVLCRDTLQIFCDPDCGYFTKENILCEGPGGPWIYQASVKNTSDQVVNSAYIQFTSPPGLSAYNQTIPLGTLAPGATSAAFNILIGPPAMPGDTVCFTVTLHAVDITGHNIECCTFEHCIVLPECEEDTSCQCNEEFFSAVALGFSASPFTTIPPPYNYTFNMLLPEAFSQCDMFYWNWGHSFATTITTGPVPVVHAFPFGGRFRVCVRVVRTQPDGTQCIAQVCRHINVPGGIFDPTRALSPYPNPTTGQVSLKLYEGISYPLPIDITDYQGRLVEAFQIESRPDNDLVRFDLQGLAPGLYTIRMHIGADILIRKVVIQR